MSSKKIKPFKAIADVKPTKKGRANKDLKYVQDFLQRFGHLKKGSYSPSKLDKQTSEALKSYQKANGKRPTGEFNKATREQMTTHRCGHVDQGGGIDFVTQCSWSKTTLTFAFDTGTNDIPGNNEFQAIRNAFKTWAKVCPLTFKEVTLSKNPDIRIGWRPANDPDHSMVGGVLAHADFPPGCSVVTNSLPKPVHFDDTEHTWVIGKVSGGFDVETVALHEIGHILGMAHSSVAGSVMFPSVSSNFTKRALTADDIAGIQSLYPIGKFKITNEKAASFPKWAATSGVKVVSGDFNGDGKTDIALVRQKNGWGTIPIAFAKGKGKWTVKNGSVGSFASWATRSGVKVLSGDFNGNGKSDIALIRQNSGWATIPIAFSKGNGNWTIKNGGVGSFASWATRTGVQVVTGDFNGDGKTDIALVRQKSGWGTIPIAFSKGDGNWTIKNGDVGSFASWATRSGVKVLSGDFNGNGKTDIALIRQRNGWNTIPIAFSKGNGNWTIKNGVVGSFARWAATSGVKVLTGDFNGNGKTDIALIRQTGGWATIPIAFSKGNGNWKITNERVGDFAAWATHSGVQVVTGDFNGNGLTDIALIRQDSGWNTIPIAFSKGDGTFQITNNKVGDFAKWAATSGVCILPGDYDGNKKTDIALVRQASGWNTVPVAFWNP